MWRIRKADEVFVDECYVMVKANVPGRVKEKVEIDDK